MDIAFLRMHTRFVRKLTDISKLLKLLRWTSVSKVSMGFLTSPKLGPNWLLPHKWEIKLAIWNMKHSISHFQMVKLKFSQSTISCDKSFTHVCKTNEISLNTLHIYTLYIDLNAPLDLRKWYNFKQLCFWNGCLNLHVWYTMVTWVCVCYSITWSKLLPNIFATGAITR